MGHILRLRVGPGDIDVLDHVNNAVYVRWVQEAAEAQSEAVGQGVRAYIEVGEVFMVRHHEIEYLRQARLGEEVDVETRVVAMTIATAQRSTTIRRAADRELLARAHTRWAYIDLSSGRPARIPGTIRVRFPVESIETDAACAALRRRSV